MVIYQIDIFPTVFIMSKCLACRRTLSRQPAQTFMMAMFVRITTAAQILPCILKNMTYVHSNSLWWSNLVTIKLASVIFWDFYLETHATGSGVDVYEALTLQ